jgi:hypothetical protein
MADEVRRRFTAARTGVWLAVFGLAAGLGIRIGGNTPDTVDFDSSAKTLTVSGKSKLGSAQIKDHSLLYKDLKLGQVVSHKDFKQFAAEVQGNFLKLDVGNLVHKGDAFAADIFAKADATFAHKGEAYVKGESDARFLHKGDTADNALKLNGLGSADLVQGHGGVVTGNLILGNTNGAVMILIGLLRADAMINQASGQAQVTLTNTSGQPMMVNGDGSKQGKTIAAAAVDMFDVGDGSVMPVQVVTQDGKHVATLTFSTFAGGQNKELLAQALVGQL